MSEARTAPPAGTLVHAPATGRPGDTDGTGGTDGTRRTGRADEHRARFSGPYAVRLPVDGVRERRDAFGRGERAGRPC